MTTTMRTTTRSEPSNLSHDTTRGLESEWVAARGEKWRAQLTGMEAMLAPVDAPLLHALGLDTPLRIADRG